MHELFTQVLSKKDLSKAGDLFSVSDQAIEPDLTEVVKTICEITSMPDYANNDNDQSVVEICITRVTSAIRETDSIEEHAEALVSLLESCLNHNLQPSNKDEDPPHAKIASDIISCIFLNYSKKSVMKLALPVAVKFLHKGNRELSRNMSSYLSLAAIESAELLAKHTQPIIDSILSGNYPLCRVLPQIYAVKKNIVDEHAMALVSLLPHCPNTEKLALLQLFVLVAENNPALLESSLPQLCEYLSPSGTVSATMQLLVNVANGKPQLLVDHVAKVQQAARTHPSTLCLAAQVIARVGRLSQVRAQEALNFVLENLSKADRSSQTNLLREATLLCSTYPALFTDKMLQEVRQCSGAGKSPPPQVKQSHGVTIVKVGGNGNGTSTSLGNTQSYLNRQEVNRIMSRPRLGGDSRSTGRLHSAHRSMTRLNVGGSRTGSVGGLHKSMTRLTSSPQTTPITITSTTAISNSGTATSVTALPGGKPWTSVAPAVSAISVSANTTSSTSTTTTSTNSNVTSTINAPGRVSSGGVTVVTTKGNGVSGAVSDRDLTFSSPTQLSVTTPSKDNLLSTSQAQISNSPIKMAPSIPVAAAAPTRRHRNTSVTLLNSANNPVASQRISVFEPYPMRDTVQHFCEKHLDKIKAYMEKLAIRIPPPAKCTIEERRAKKLAKLHFACQGRGEHCLYSRTFFTMKTRNPRVWIHLMFLALQARSDCALSSRDASVSSLKNCWDILKCENKSFLTLVTSSFPCPKDQDSLLHELRHSGFFDVFECREGNEDGIVTWGCFLCNHPERAVGFLQDTEPVIEGQLKEKKGRWKIFKRWRTRYFTLSGAHLSYKGDNSKDVRPISVNQIRSVKVSRGARNIPKAFEIFTGSQSLILKPKGGKNAEEWVQCLSIVVAHSQAKEPPTVLSKLGLTHQSTSQKKITPFSPV